MDNNLVKIDPKEYGLAENTAKLVEDAFKPMLSKMTDLENEYNEIVKQEISEDLCKEAKSLRLQYVKVRTGTAAIHKSQKALYLAGGRFVDGWKNAQLFASQGKEEDLSGIENHYINIENVRIAELQETRTCILQKYDVDYFPTDLGNMDAEVWENYIAGVSLSYNQKLLAEKEAEQARVEAEQKAIAEQEAIRIENARLKKAQVKREKEIQIEQQKARQLLEKERKQRQAEAVKAKSANEFIIEKARKEKEAIAAENNKRLAEMEKQLDHAITKTVATDFNGKTDKRKVELILGKLIEITFPTMETTWGATVMQSLKSNINDLIDYSNAQIKKL